MYHEPTLLGLSFCGKIEGCSSVEASSVSNTTYCRLSGSIVYCKQRHK